jgi:VanZ family protein
MGIVMRDWLLDITLKRVALLGAALSYLIIALLSLLPAAYRLSISFASDKLEHTLAYLLLGVLSVLAMRQTIDARRLALGIVVYAAVLELGQALIPSRVPSFGDFVWSAAGAIVGVSLAALAVNRVARQLSRAETARVES